MKHRGAEVFDLAQHISTIATQAHAHARTSQFTHAKRNVLARESFRVTF